MGKCQSGGEDDRRKPRGQKSTLYSNSTAAVVTILITLTNGLTPILKMTQSFLKKDMHNLNLKNNYSNPLNCLS